MNLRRLAASIVVLFVFLLVTDWLIHGYWLWSAYRETSYYLWRPDPELFDRAGWIPAGQFLAAVAFSILWAAFGSSPATARRAMAFGLGLGLFRQASLLGEYALHPYPGVLVAKWFVASVAQSVVLGLLAFAIYRPLPVPAAFTARRRLAIAIGVVVLLVPFAVVFQFRTKSQKLTPTAAWMQTLSKTWCVDSPPKPWSIQTSSQISKDGVDSIRFELRDGFTDMLGRSSFRAEIDPKIFPPMRSVRWYAFSIYIPGDFPKEDNRLVIAQWHGVDKRHLGEGSHSPVLAFRYQDGRFFVTHRHSADRIVADYHAVPNDVLLETREFPLDQWNDFIVQAKWSFEADGFINVWWNKKQIVQHRGPVGYNDDFGPNFRFGLYRDPTPSTYVIYFNDVKEGFNPEEIGLSPQIAFP